MITIHHLQRSQSERIVWLCEELDLPYRLKLYTRDPDTKFAPPALAAVSPLGAAPVIEDGDVRLAESGAIADLILARHAGGRLRPLPEDPRFPDYLYWFHFANGTLQPAMGRQAALRRAGIASDHPTARTYATRLGRLLAHLDGRLAAEPFLAGPDFTAADIMTVFSLTTMRLFAPLDLATYPATRAYLGRIGARDAYRRAMAAGDPGFEPMLD